VVRPWKLDDGIFLEDADLMLQWGVPFDVLQELGSPQVNRQSTSIHLTWTARRVIGGLLADVGACRIFEPPNPRAFHIYLPEFHWASVVLVERHREPSSAHGHMRRVHDVIASATGAMATSYPDYAHNLPSIMWRLHGMRISLGPSCRYERSGRDHRLESIRLQLSFAHEPSGYDGLREQAEQIRTAEGKGREVDHVAWHGPYDHADS
jgi:hypothetical protein